MTPEKKPSLCKFVVTYVSLSSALFLWQITCLINQENLSLNASLSFQIIESCFLLISLQKNKVYDLTFANRILKKWKIRSHNIANVIWDVKHCDEGGYKLEHCCQVSEGTVASLPSQLGSSCLPRSVSRQLPIILTLVGGPGFVRQQLQDTRHCPVTRPSPCQRILGGTCFGW